jgi:hypothetical protein
MWKKLFRHALAFKIAVAIVLFPGCGDPPTMPTMPSPPDLPQPTTTTTIREPVNPGRPDMSAVRGVLSFGLVTPPPGHDSGAHFQFVKQWCWKCLDKGYNTLSIGSETSDWGFASYLPGGPQPYTPEWRRNLITTIEAAGEAGCWVQLVVVLTIKSRPFREQLDYTRKVRDLTQKYEHVYYEAVNEWYVHSSLSIDEAVRLVEVLKRTGKDVLLDEPGLTVRRKVKATVTVRSVHPDRNPDPTIEQLRRARQRYGLLHLNETTCYASDAEISEHGLAGRGTIAMNGRGTEEQRRQQIRTYISNTIHANDSDPETYGGLRFFFHHIAGLMGESLDWWLPDWRVS